MTVDVQPSSAVGLADPECLPTVDGDVATGSSMSVGVQPSSIIAYNLLYLVDLTHLITVLLFAKCRPLITKRILGQGHSQGNGHNH